MTRVMMGRRIDASTRRAEFDGMETDGDVWCDRARVVFAREQLKTCGVNPQYICSTNTTMESDEQRSERRGRRITW